MRRRTYRPVTGRGTQSPKWAKAVRCPWCGALPEENCRDEVNNTSVCRAEVHAGRLALAEAEGRRPKRRRFAPVLVTLLLVVACGDDGPRFLQVPWGFCGNVKEFCTKGERCLDFFGDLQCLRECESWCACCAFSHDGGEWCLETASMCRRADEAGLLVPRERQE